VKPVGIPVPVASTKGEGSKKRKGRGLNGGKYVAQVLKGLLKDFVEELEVERGHSILVVDDGAPGHTSKVASKAQSELNLKKLTHPPKSPHLNPIKPLWYECQSGNQGDSDKAIYGIKIHKISIITIRITYHQIKVDINP
jgi:hypothetical protein